MLHIKSQEIVFIKFETYEKSSLLNNKLPKS